MDSHSKEKCHGPLLIFNILLRKFNECNVGTVSKKWQIQLILVVILYDFHYSVMLVFQSLHSHLLTLFTFQFVLSRYLTNHNLNSQYISVCHFVLFCFRPNCGLRLSLIHSYDGVDVLHSKILKRAMPLTHLKVFFCEKVHFLSNQWSDQGSTPSPNFLWNKNV